RHHKSTYCVGHIVRSSDSSIVVHVAHKDCLYCRLAGSLGNGGTSVDGRSSNFFHTRHQHHKRLIFNYVSASAICDMEILFDCSLVQEVMKSEIGSDSIFMDFCNALHTMLTRLLKSLPLVGILAIQSGPAFAGGELPGFYQDSGLSPNRASVNHNNDE